VAATGTPSVPADAGGRPAWLRTAIIFVLALAASALVGWIDLVTGELRLTTLYVAIIIGASWLGGLRLGLAFCIVETALCLSVNAPTRDRPLEQIYFALENAGNLAVFLFCAVTVDRLRLRLRLEQVQKANLARYLPAPVARRLARQGLAAMSPRRHRAAILFLDIRDFTALSRSVTPETLFAFLRDYRALVADVVAEHGGVIDKFIGDGVLAVFGVPRPQEDDATRAIRCALAIHGKLVSWSVERTRSGEFAVDVGIGVHYGEIVLGAIGDERRLEFTVVGDTVNVASRIEQQTRDLCIPLLVSASAFAAAGPASTEDEWVSVTIDTIRGVDGPLTLWYPRHLESEQKARRSAAAVVEDGSR
jgi:class 3 adenylate cyclase